MIDRETKGLAGREGEGKEGTERKIKGVALSLNFFSLSSFFFHSAAVLLPVPKKPGRYEDRGSGIRDARRALTLVERRRGGNTKEKRGRTREKKVPRRRLSCFKPKNRFTEKNKKRHALYSQATQTISLSTELRGDIPRERVLARIEKSLKFGKREVGVKKGEKGHSTATLFPKPSFTISSPLFLSLSRFLLPLIHGNIAESRALRINGAVSASAKKERERRAGLEGGRRTARKLNRSRRAACRTFQRRLFRFRLSLSLSRSLLRSRSSPNTRAREREGAWAPVSLERARARARKRAESEEEKKIEKRERKRKSDFRLGSFFPFFSPSTSTPPASPLPHATASPLRRFPFAGRSYNSMLQNSIREAHQSTLIGAAAGAAAEATAAAAAAAASASASAFLSLTLAVSAPTGSTFPRGHATPASALALDSVEEYQSLPSGRSSSARLE